MITNTHIQGSAHPDHSTTGCLRKRAMREGHPEKNDQHNQTDQRRPRSKADQGQRQPLGAKVFFKIILLKEIISN